MIQAPLILLSQAAANGQVQAAASGEGGPGSLVQALPWPAHATVLIALIGGLIVWMAGGKVLKPTFAVFGAAIGGLFGLVTLPALGMGDPWGVPAAVIGLVIGGLVGMSLALVGLKLAITVTAGAAFALIGLMGSLVWVEHAPGTPPQPPPAQSGEIPPAMSLVPGLGDLPAQAAEPDESDAASRAWREIEEALRSLSAFSAERVRTISGAARDELGRRWDGISAADRIVVLGATLGGFSVGLAIGFLMPKRSTRLVTAMAGAAVWLTAAAWLVDAFGPGWARRGTDLPAAAWAGAWVMGSLVGLALQSRRGGKSKKDSKDDDD